MNEAQSKLQPVAVSTPSGGLGRRIYLPNFWRSLPWPILAMLAAQVDGSWEAWLGACGMVGLLAMCGLCDIMANHYRQKLLNQTCEDLAMAS